MGRTAGAPNITPFEHRREIPVAHTSQLQFIKDDMSPLRQFETIVRRQQTFIKWMQTRHERIIEQKREIIKLDTGRHQNRAGAYDKSYRKHRWHAQRMALLDVVNAFEFFYKTTIIRLAYHLHGIVPSSEITGNVNASFLWESQRGYSIADMIFEHRLFHDLAEVNKCTKMLIGKGRYECQPGNSRYRQIQCIFQIRHTLSHNCGKLTQSDAAKIKKYQYQVSPDGVIDPDKDFFGDSVMRHLRTEARDFTDWIKDETIQYLRKKVTVFEYSEIQKDFGGTDTDWQQIPGAAKSN